MVSLTDLSSVEHLINLTYMFIQTTQTNLGFGLILSFLNCFIIISKQVTHGMINSVNIMGYLQDRKNVLMVFQVILLLITILYYKNIQNCF